MRSLIGSRPTTTRRLRRSTAHSLWEDRESRQGAPQSDNLEIVSPQFIPLKPAQPQNTPTGSTPRHCALGFIGANHSKRPTAQRPHDVAPLPFDQSGGMLVGSLHAAIGKEAYPVRRARCGWLLSRPQSSRDAFASSCRGPLRPGKGCLGGALRGSTRLLARVRRRCRQRLP